MSDLGQIWPFLGQKYIFWCVGVKVLVLSYQGTNETPLCVEKIDRCCLNWPRGTKMCNFYPKIWIFGAKSQYFALESRFLIFIFEKDTFFFSQLFMAVARAWCQWPVCSPRIDDSFPTFGMIFDFSFPSYGRLCKKTRPMRQKVFPLPTVGATSASNSVRVGKQHWQRVSKAL